MSPAHAELASKPRLSYFAGRDVTRPCPAKNSFILIVYPSRLRYDIINLKKAISITATFPPGIELTIELFRNSLRQDN
jgi:hypothetical protein